MRMRDIRCLRDLQRVRDIRPSRDSFASGVPRESGVIRASLRAGRLYGFTGWAYIAGNSISHPETLSLRLTHFAPWPHEGDFGLICFVASAACHLALELWPERGAGP